MRVLNLEPRDFDGDAIRTIESFATYSALPSDATLGSSSFWTEIGSADVIWTRLAFDVDDTFLGNAGNLRAVVSATTGLNHIDLAACAARDIAVISLKGETAFLGGITATAELTFSLILEAMRHTGRAHQSVTGSGAWDRDRFKGLQLSGMTLGVVGLGRLGSMVAKYGDAFGMKVVYHDLLPDHMLSPPAFARRLPLERLLAESDIVSLHVDYRSQYRRLFDAAAFSRMKPTAWFINTARGELVDEEALVAALKGSVIAGAALDVIADEAERSRLGLNHPLVEYARSSSNLVLTPHIGGACTDAMAAAERFTARKLRDHFLTRGSVAC